MRLLYVFLDEIRRWVRHGSHALAVLLDRLTRGKITPNTITYISLAGHGLAAAFIVTQRPIVAAVTIAIFGLMDTLDGELARLQKRASSAGMVLDATTDRLKETILYSALVYAISTCTNPEQAVWPALALGLSICVSYVKAKGETALSATKLTPNQKNRIFQDGILRYEVRMSLLIVGLLTAQVAIACMVIAALALVTVIDRYIKIQRALRT